MTWRTTSLYQWKSKALTSDGLAESSPLQFSVSSIMCNYIMPRNINPLYGGIPFLPQAKQSGRKTVGVAGREQSA